MEKHIIEPLVEQGLSTEKIAIELGIWQSTVRYWLKKHGLQTRVTVNRINKTRLCLTCNITKPQTDFYLMSEKPYVKYSSHCKKCQADRVRKMKQKAIDYLGGSCSRCGYNKCNAALEFHHIDPSNKDITPSRLIARLSFKKIKEELDKCILLCSNCHREEHAAFIQD